MPMSPIEKAALQVQWRIQARGHGRPVQDRVFAGDYDKTSMVAPLVIAALTVLLELLRYCYSDPAAMKKAASNPGLINRLRARFAVRRAMRDNPDPAFDGVSAGELVGDAAAVAGQMRDDDFVTLIKSLEKDDE